MKQVAALISAVSGAIVGVVKLIGLVLDANWFLPRWQDVAVTYYFVHMVTAAIVLVIFSAKTNHALFRLKNLPLVGRKRFLSEPKKYTRNLLKGLSQTALFWIILGVIVPYLALIVGSALAVVTLLQLPPAVIARLGEKKKITAKCPYCFTKVHMLALRCHRCYGELDAFAFRYPSPDTPGQGSLPFVTGELRQNQIPGAGLYTTRDVDGALNYVGVAGRADRKR